MNVTLLKLCPGGTGKTGMVQGLAENDTLILIHDTFIHFLLHNESTYR